MEAHPIARKKSEIHQVQFTKFVSNVTISLSITPHTCTDFWCTPKSVFLSIPPVSIPLSSYTDHKIAAARTSTLLTSHPTPMYFLMMTCKSYPLKINKNLENLQKLRFHSRPWPKAGAGRSRARAINVGLGLKFLSLGWLEPGQAGPVTSLSP